MCEQVSCVGGILKVERYDIRYANADGAANDYVYVCVLIVLLHQGMPLDMEHDDVGVSWWLLRVAAVIIVIAVAIMHGE